MASVSVVDSSSKVSDAPDGAWELHIKVQSIGLAVTVTVIDPYRHTLSAWRRLTRGADCFMTFGHSGRVIETADDMFTFTEERHDDSTIVSTTMVPRSVLEGKLDEAISAAAAAGRPFAPEAETSTTDDAMRGLAGIMVRTLLMRAELHPTIHGV